MFTIMTRKKTRIYLLCMLILMISITIFKVLDGLVLRQLYHTKDDLLMVITLLSLLQLDTKLVTFHFSESFLNGKIYKYMDGIYTYDI